VGAPDWRVFEDEHLLVVNKPPGWNTHAPSPYGGPGLFDWLRHREPRWEHLAILQRLDKETSGVMVFAKTPVACRSLAGQFATRSVVKAYWLLTDRDVPFNHRRIQSHIARAGARYQSHPRGGGGDLAITEFRRLGARDGHALVEARPLTGRTHQIRVHAAEAGLTILGDVLYGGSPHPRVCLHSRALRFRHPARDEEVEFAAEPDFASAPAVLLRRSLFDGSDTSAWRMVHGAADGWPGWQIDRWGEYALASVAEPPNAEAIDRFRNLAQRAGVTGAAVRVRPRTRLKSADAEQELRWVYGERAPATTEIRENGIRFEVQLSGSYAPGLFLDQRDSRRRFQTRFVGAGFRFPWDTLSGRTLLNLFAYTCGFSLAAAVGGAHTTSVDLSRHYLDWGRRNFALNGLKPEDHLWFSSEAGELVRRLKRQGRRFDLVAIDPPTFSRSKSQGIFQVERDLPGLVSDCVGLLSRPGVVYLSTNNAGWPAEDFERAMIQAINLTDRRILQSQFCPAPPDFPVTREEPPYFKGLWVALG
jgi:23S rRNA (cytosine1962-C5)-methyltransferase